MFAALEAAGFAAEILFPAALQRFGVFEPDAAFVLVSLTLATWLYHFCQIGASAMVLVTSLVALNTGVLPMWLAMAGFVVTLLTLLHVLLGLVAALVGLLWIVAVSVLMLTGGVGEATGGPRRRTCNDRPADPLFTNCLEEIFSETQHHPGYAVAITSPVDASILSSHLVSFLLRS